jgi:ubiquinone/menaquinone biosynthesis C-methylase UbiE
MHIIKSCRRSNRNCALFSRRLLNRSLSGTIVAAQNHLHLAHTLIDQVIKQGDICIDATAGNGLDSLFLAKRVLNSPTGHLHCLDIQVCKIFVFFVR